MGRISNDRVAAVRTLASFQSGANERLLRNLLNDPQRDHYAQGQLDYTTREAAYEVLKKWGVAVAKPVLIEKLPNDR